MEWVFRTLNYLPEFRNLTFHLLTCPFTKNDELLIQQGALQWQFGLDGLESTFVTSLKWLPHSLDRPAIFFDWICIVGPECSLSVFLSQL